MAGSEGMRVSVDYRLSRRMYTRATHASWITQPRFQAVVLMMAALWVATSFVVGLGGDVETQLPTFTYMLIGIAFYFLYPNYAFASDPRNRLDNHFEFDSSGIRYRFLGREATVAWSDLRQATETRDFYVLALNGKLRVALPKSEFPAGAEQRFRLMAALSGVPFRG